MSIVRRLDQSDDPFWTECQACGRKGMWRPQRGNVWHPAAASYPERFCRVRVADSVPWDQQEAA